MRRQKRDCGPIASTVQRMRDHARAGILEAAAWAVGGALLIAYAAAQWHFARSHDSGLNDFASARRQVQLTSLEPPEPLRTAAPDMTLWSSGRIAAYQREDRVAAPQAVLRIRAIDLEVPVYEGVTEPNLSRGAAWIQQTAPLGGPGNTGIAAHRDGYFRALREIEIGDHVELQTLLRTRVYAIDDVRIVAPNEVHVLAPSDDARLTLITCYPFYTVGPAPKRFVVRGRAVRARNAS